MASRDKTSQEIISAAEQYVKYSDRTKLESYSLADLKKADMQLGKADVNSGYRKAITERISEIVSNSEKTSQSKIRAVGYVVALAIALIVLLLGVLLS